MEKNKVSKKILSSGTIYNLGDNIQIVGNTYINHKHKTMVDLTDEQYNVLVQKIETAL